MNSIYLLVPLSLTLVGAAVWAFFWAVDRGQFEDLEDGSRAALEEDDFVAPGGERAATVSEGSNSPRP